MFLSGIHPTFLCRACVIWVTGEEKVGAEERTKRQRLKSPTLRRWQIYNCGILERSNGITEPVARKILGRDADTYSEEELTDIVDRLYAICLLYTSPSPRDQRGSRMPSSA